MKNTVKYDLLTKRKAYLVPSIHIARILGVERRKFAQMEKAGVFPKEVYEKGSILFPVLFGVKD